MRTQVATRVHVDLPLTAGTVVELSRAASHHLLHVLRLTPGASLVLFNNRGGQFQGRLLSSARGSASVEVGAFEDPPTESHLSTHLAVVLSKGERMDLVLQKSVELGISRITLLTSDHCAVHLDQARTARKLTHWQGVVIAASEQCGRNRFPTLAPPVAFAEFVQHCPGDLRLLLHPTGEPLAELPSTPGSITLLSGPEGGFSSAEVELAKSRGLRTTSMGPRTLRAETAPLAALALVQHRWGDL